MDPNELVDAAREAMENSYSPYSNFRVGAALLAGDGRLITGTNVENASLGLTICAERSAIFKAISEGIRDFSTMAVITDTPHPALPCGACRQVMAEFNPNLELLLANVKGEFQSFSLSSLLPYPFLPESLSPPPRVMTTRVPQGQYRTTMKSPHPKNSNSTADNSRPSTE